MLQNSQVIDAFISGFILKKLVYLSCLFFSHILVVASFMEAHVIIDSFVVISKMRYYKLIVF